MLDGVFEYIIIDVYIASYHLFFMNCLTHILFESVQIQNQ